MKIEMDNMAGRKTCYFLLLSLMVLPGVYIGNTIVNVCDFCIPICLIIVLLKSNNEFKIVYSNLFLIIYVLIAITSIILASFDADVFFPDLFLKWMRLAIVAMIPCILHFYRLNGLRLNEYQVIKYVIYFATITSILGMLLYFSGSELYQPPQEISLLDGEIGKRAGGVFADPATFSLILLFGFTLNCLVIIEIRNVKKIFFATLILIVAGICIATNRTAIISIFIVFMLLFVREKIKVKLKIIFLLLGLVIAVLLLFYYNESFQYIIMTRFLIIDTASSYIDWNDVLAGRLNLWISAIDSFLDWNDLRTFLWGTGYKFVLDNSNNFMSDNNFISAFLSTGLLGGITYICWWGALINEILKIDKSKIYNMAIPYFFIIFLIFSFLGDALTMYRAAGTLLFLYSLAIENIMSDNISSQRGVK